MAAKTKKKTTKRRRKAGDKTDAAPVTRKRAATRARNWKPRFIEVLALTGVVAAACEAAGISRETAYKHKHADAAFAKKWGDAFEDGTDQLELEARRRAMNGSDTMLKFLLAGNRPGKYARNIKIGGDGTPIGINAKLSVVDAMRKLRADEEEENEIVDVTPGDEY